MDILAKKRVLFVLIWVFHFGSIRSAAANERLPWYRLAKIDFFEGISSGEVKQTSFTAEELWSEVSISAGGEIRVAYPPYPVVEFLDAPTLETGKRYLEWNAVRFEKLRQAQEVLEQL